MNVNDIYGGNFVKAEHLHGQDATVQVSAVTVEEVGDDGEKKKQVVLAFAGMDKRLGCNATNATTIAAMYGDEIEAWIGQSVTLFPTTCQFGAKTVACIRVRPMPPQGVAQVASQQAVAVPAGPVSF